MKKLFSLSLLLSLIISPAFAMNNNLNHLQCNIKLTTDKYDDIEKTQDVVWDFYINNFRKKVYDWNNTLLESYFRKDTILVKMQNTDDIKIFLYINQATGKAKVQSSIKVHNKPEYPYINAPAISEGTGICTPYSREGI